MVNGGDELQEELTAVTDDLPWDREPIRRQYRTCVRCGSRWGGYLIAFAGWVCAGCMVELAIESERRVQKQIAAFRAETEDKGNG